MRLDFIQLQSETPAGKRCTRGGAQQFPGAQNPQSAIKIIKNSSFEQTVQNPFPPSLLKVFDFLKSFLGIPYFQ